MRNRKLFAIPLMLIAAACGGGDPPGNGNGNGTDPPTDPPSITSITPSPLLEGATATITGTNFSSSSAANLVRIDGGQAVVRSASSTQLTLTVPRTCGATRTGTVTVSVSSRSSAGFSVEIDPNALTMNLAVGEQAILRGEDSYCLEIPQGQGEVQYLVGLQSTNELGGTKTNVRLAGTVGAAALASGIIPVERGGSRVVSATRALPAFPADPGLRKYLRHRSDHTTRLQEDMQAIASLGIPSQPSSVAGDGPAQVVVTGSEQVGDRVTLRVRDHTISDCNEFTEVTAQLKIKTANAMWFVDDANPQPGFSDAQLQDLSDLFESSIAPADEAMFGSPGDQDGNGRVAIVITEVVNAKNGTQFGTIGYVNTCDWFTRGNPFETSNEGEFFYAIAPDEGNEHGQQIGIDFLMDFMPLVLAHEYTHVIQFSRRFVEQAGNSTFLLMDLFEAEGQATLGEEIVGHSVLGNEPLQNYAGDLVWDDDEVLPFDWYLNPFTDLAFFYGASPGAERKVDGAPEECTWTQDNREDPDPCLSRASWYGVTWSFYRWAADQIALEGGDAPTLQKSIIDSRLKGFANLASAFSSLGSLNDLLAQWAASLYTDERIEGAPNPRLTFPSWDLVSVGEGVADWARLEPRARSFTGFIDDLTIRSPSMAYWLVEGTDNPSMTLHATSATGSALPDHIQMWVVRMR